MKITVTILVVALVAALALALGIWVWGVMHTFHVPDPWTTLPAMLLQTFKHPQLRPIALWALVKAVVPVAAVLWLLDQLDDSKDKPRVVRGPRIVSARELTRLTREHPWANAWGKWRVIFGGRGAARVQIEVAGVPIPLGCESGHLLLAGSTGSGKSTVVDEMLACARERGDRVIVVDPNAHALARFAKKGDLVLNPFDARSPAWSLFNELRGDYDYERLAKSVVPDASDVQAREWHGYAQQLLAETMRAMAQAGEVEDFRLVYWLTQASAAELAALVAGTAAAGQFAPGAEKALASTRFILAKHLAAFQHLKPGKPGRDWSLRHWLENDRGNLYITWREDQLASLRPMVSAWVDILIATVLTLPENAQRPLWLFLDELASLERLTSLEAGLTKGRKHGLRIVAGLQATAQLDALYGAHHATTLRSCFRSLLALGGSNADPVTAKVIAEGLGQCEVEAVTTSHGPNGATKSVQRRTEYAVMPSQLMALAPLRGYLKLAGDYPIAPVRLTPVRYRERVPAFVERKGC